VAGTVVKLAARVATAVARLAAFDSAEAGGEFVISVLN
jgi:hypothetical protein